MITFVRHGQTAVNQAGLLQGRTDPPLTALGAAQADALADCLSARPVARVLSSPLQRARNTADAIAAVHGVPVVVDDRLVELDYGEWDERRFTDVPRESWQQWRDDPTFAPPGGESLRSVTARVAELCAELGAAPPSEPGDTGEGIGEGIIVAVSHVSPIKAAVCWALGVDERITWRMHLSVASITQVGVRPDGSGYLVNFNDVAHLPT